MTALPRSWFEAVRDFESALSVHANREDRLLLAVSGGIDSTALVELTALSSFGEAASVTVAHVDHHTRAESASEAEFVRAAADRHGYRFHAASVGGGGRDDEARLRAERYRALTAAADAEGCRWILTGHNRDDQVETILFRMFRGSGRGGLAGMAPRRGRILRPLLDFERERLERLLIEHDVEWIDDPSNASPRYTRNRIRNDLIPAVAAALGAEGLRRLPELAKRWRAEDEFLESEADRYLRYAAVGADAAVLDLVRLAEAPAAVRTRVIRAWLRGAGFRGPVEIAHVTSVERLVENGAEGAEIELPGVRVRRKENALGVGTVDPLHEDSEG